MLVKSWLVEVVSGWKTCEMNTMRFIEPNSRAELLDPPYRLPAYARSRPAPKPARSRTLFDT
jgi:hypothetical protein